MPVLFLYWIKVIILGMDWAMRVYSVQFSSILGIFAPRLSRTH